MSTPIGSNVPIPYAAPWVAQFNRYSTQAVPAATPFPTVNKWTVPVGQWWRIVTLTTELDTNASAGTRLLTVTFMSPSGTVVKSSFTSGQAASVFGTYVLAPGFNAFTSPAVQQNQYFQTPLADMLWGPKTTIELDVSGFIAGDTLSGSTVITEIYTEFRTTDDSGDTVLIPSPVLT